MKFINVAVAVIHYKNEYLLAYRNAAQHQGNRYEFVGGKIETNETAKQGLIRELYEEIGLDLEHNATINSLGQLTHEYLDEINPVKSKVICLNVYRVALTREQYQKLRHKNKGCEGQSLHWVNKTDLTSGKYKLPDANKTIIEWFKLPDTIVITLEVNQIQKNKLDEVSNAAKISDERSWLDYYSQYLELNACVYVRLKEQEIKKQANIILKLLNTRPDINLIINWEVAKELNKNQKLPEQVIAQHMTQADIEKLKVDEKNDDYDLTKLVNLPITTSCHSQDSINKVNKLSEYLIKQTQYKKNIMPIIGIYISPVNYTNTHPEVEPLGWEGFKNLALLSKIPVIALGGLKPIDLITARKHGADKIAGIRKFIAK